MPRYKIQKFESFAVHDWNSGVTPRVSQPFLGALSQIFNIVIMPTPGIGDLQKSASLPRFLSFSLKMQKVFLVSDNPEACRTNARISGFWQLHQAGEIELYPLSWNSTAVPAGAQIVCIGDWEPAVDGLCGAHQLLRLRQRFPRQPLLWLSSQTDRTDVIESLRLGAADFLILPATKEEVALRLQAVEMRGRSLGLGLELAIGDLRLNVQTREASCSGQSLALTPTEFRLLELLMQHAGGVVSRGELCQSVWQTGLDGMTNVIEVHVNRLRGKLRKKCPHDYIKTARGRGYYFEA